MVVRALTDLVPHHLVFADGPGNPAEWRGRAMLCGRLEMLPVECVARGDLAGPGGPFTSRAVTISGVALPPGWRTGPGCRADLHPDDEGARWASTTSR